MDKSVNYMGSYMLKWLTIATLMGIGGGLSAIFLNKTIYYVSFAGSRLPSFIAPAIGGAIICLIFLWDKEARGFGTNRYIQAVNVNNGYLKPKTFISKIIATAVTLGFHGSGGVEGPMVVIGGSMANVLSKIPFLNRFLQKDDHRILTICGAAGAIGAVFKSPLGGGIFVVEVLYRSSLPYTDLFPAMLSSTIGFIIYSMTSNASSLFSIPDYHPDVLNLPFFILAAVLSGIASLFFMWFFGLSIKTFNRIKKLKKICPIIGGLITGVIIYFLPQVSGIGLPVIQQLIDKPFPIYLLLIFFFGKVLATSSTVGSGNSAGLVIPALFTGAICGNMTAGFFANGNPGLTATLVVAGMAASLASLANVPVAAAVMLVEMMGLHLGVSAIIGSIIGYAIGHSKIIFGTTNSLQSDFEEGKKFRLIDRCFEDH